MPTYCGGCDVPAKEQQWKRGNNSGVMKEDLPGQKAYSQVERSTHPLTPPNSTALVPPTHSPHQTPPHLPHTSTHPSALDFGVVDEELGREPLLLGVDRLGVEGDLAVLPCVQPRDSRLQFELHFGHIRVQPSTQHCLDKLLVACTLCKCVQCTWCIASHA